MPMTLDGCSTQSLCVSSIISLSSSNHQSLRNKSHLSLDALDLSVAQWIHILSFPPHCSHKLQSLDVSVFGLVKTYYKSQCSAWRKNNVNKVLEIRQITGIVCTTLDLALTTKTIESGFSATGTQPFNAKIFTNADFVQAVKFKSLLISVKTTNDKSFTIH